MAVEPEPTKGPERLAAPKGVEVKPAPIPQFDGSNAADVTDAFAYNFALVSGGEVATVDGRIIQTDGILGSAENRIDDRLEEIAGTHQALESERGQYGTRRLGGPRAVREIEAERQNTNNSWGRRAYEINSRIQRQQERMDAVLRENRVPDETRKKWDLVIEVEKFLDANKDTHDLSPLSGTLRILGWTQRAVTRERIETRVDTYTDAVNGYVE